MTTIRDKAYQAATGAFLTESFYEEDFRALTADELSNMVWEGVEHLDPSDLFELIDDNAQHIISLQFEELQADVKALRDALEKLTVSDWIDADDPDGFRNELNRMTKMAADALEAFDAKVGGL